MLLIGLYLPLGRVGHMVKIKQNKNTQIAEDDPPSRGVCQSLPALPLRLLGLCSFPAVFLNYFFFFFFFVVFDCVSYCLSSQYIHFLLKFLLASNDRKQTEGCWQVMGGGWAEWVMGIQEGTCYNEYWVLYISMNR